MTQELYEKILEGALNDLPPLDETNLYDICEAPKTFNLPMTGYADAQISVLHLLALTGGLHLVPSPILNSGKALRHQDSIGRNIYHFAAASGHLNQLQELSIRRLCNNSNHPYTALDYAAANRHIDQIPNHILKRAMVIKNKSGHPFITQAAKFGNLDQLPEELQDPKYFVNREVLHQNSVYKNLASIPKKLLTKEILEFKNWSGNTILHEVAKIGGKLPDIDLTLLLMPNTRGKTALKTLMDRNHINTIIDRQWPEVFRPIVGDQLWSANNDLTKPAETVSEAPDIDIF